MRKLNAGIFVLLVLIAGARGSLLETEVQLEKRYGKPVSLLELSYEKVFTPKEKAKYSLKELFPIDDKTQRYYLYKNFKITVSFIEGKSRSEVVEKLLGSGNNPKAKVFSNEEVKLWLDTNSMGETWLLDKGQDTGTHKFWLLQKNGQEIAAATFENESYMCFMTSEFAASMLQDNAKTSKEVR